MSVLDSLPWNTHTKAPKSRLPDPAMAAAALMKIREREVQAATLPEKPGIFLEYPRDPVAWIERYFYIPETEDHHIVLPEYQRAALRAALARDENDDFLYSLMLWSDVKKSGKSAVAAAVALWMAWNSPWGSIKIVANDLKQADSRVSYYLRRAVTLHPIMRDMVKIKPSGYLVEFPNHCRIEAIPVDPKGEAGGNDDAVFYSELWAANNEASQRLWTETTLAPLKYGRSFRWVETYAGFNGKSPLLEQLYESGIKEGVRLPMASQFDPILEAYENPPARMFAMWNGNPRCPWQTETFYDQERAVLLPSEFNRVHRNMWSAPSDAFCPVEWWDACQGNLPAHDKESTHIMAMDAAVDGDTFGVLMINGNGTDNYYVRYANAWKPPGNGQHIDFNKVEEEVLRLLDAYNVAEICYDPYQLENMSQRLRQTLKAHLHEFGQGSPRLIADKGLRDLIREHRIHHSGDPDLRLHVIQADAKTEGEHLRIVKRSQHMKIDLCVCLSMATSRAVYWQI